MGNNNSNLLTENMSDVQLSRLPMGTSWSFQKCILGSQGAKVDETPKKNDNSKRNNDAKENVDNQSTKKSGKKNEVSNTTSDSPVSDYISWEISEASKEFRKALNLVGHVGGQDLSVEKVTAVYNPTLVESFTSRLAIFKARFSENANIFMKQDWKRRDDPSKEREKVTEVYERYVNSFAWNKGLLVPVIACVSVCTESEIESICKFGFNTSSPQATFGKFGQGVYVANSPAQKVSAPEGKKALINFLRDCWECVSCH